MRQAKPYKRGLKNIEFHLLDTGRFALEEEGDRIAQVIQGFLAKHKTVRKKEVRKWPTDFVN